MPKPAVRSWNQELTTGVPIVKSPIKNSSITSTLELNHFAFTLVQNGSVQVAQTFEAPEIPTKSQCHWWAAKESPSSLAFVRDTAVGWWVGNGCPSKIKHPNNWKLWIFIPPNMSDLCIDHHWPIQLSKTSHRIYGPELETNQPFEDVYSCRRQCRQWRHRWRLASPMGAPASSATGHDKTRPMGQKCWQVYGMFRKGWGMGWLLENGKARWFLE